MNESLQDKIMRLVPYDKLLHYIIGMWIFTSMILFFHWGLALFDVVLAACIREFMFPNDKLKESAYDITTTILGGLTGLLIYYIGVIQ